MNALAIFVLVLFPRLRAQDTGPDVTSLVCAAICLQVQSSTPSPSPAPSPVPSPTPEPVPESKCSACNGTGKNGDGSNARKCWKCGGTGRGVSVGESLPSSRPYFLVFSIENCAPCRLLAVEIEKLSAQGWKVDAGLESHIICVRADADNDSSDLARKYGVSSYPSIVAVGADGVRIRSLSERLANPLGAAMNSILTSDGSDSDDTKSTDQSMLQQLPARRRLFRP